MSEKIDSQVKTALDAAIQQGVQPKAPRNGLGLVLPSGSRFRTLYDKKGLTPAGKYYYEKSGIAPPGKFDFQQDLDFIQLARTKATISLIDQLSLLLMKRLR